MEKHTAFLAANAGFVHDYQLIDVQDYEGKGESEPNPYFYQNLGEGNLYPSFISSPLISFPLFVILMCL